MAAICTHYKRRCFLHPPCCKPGVFYECRVCHDEKSGHEIGLHRFEITEIKCASCHRVQPVGSSCVECKEIFGDYFCPDCRLWSTGRDIYHCEGCKLCRNGRREDWRHCDTCNVCYQTNYYEEHVCSNNKLETTCPICWEYMFDSRKQISFMPCGHPIHEECLNVMVMDRDQLTCPSCRTLIIQVADPVVEEEDADGNPKRIRLSWPIVRLHVNSTCNYNSLEDYAKSTRYKYKCRRCNTRFPSVKELVKHHIEKHSPDGPRMKRRPVGQILARLKQRRQIFRPNSEPWLKPRDDDEKKVPVQCNASSTRPNILLPCTADKDEDEEKAAIETDIPSESSIPGPELRVDPNTSHNSEVDDLAD